MLVAASRPIKVHNRPSRKSVGSVAFHHLGAELLCYRMPRSRVRGSHRVSMPVSQSLSKHAELAALAARIGAGDRQAEVALMLRLAPSVREIVRGQCRAGESQIEDIVQDILCTLLAHLRARRVRDLQALNRYVRNMIRNACLAHYRQQIKRLPLLSDFARSTSDDDPAGAADQHQRCQMVREVLAELPIHRDREVLRRFYLENQACERVCADLGIARHHFNRVTYRARTRMLEAMWRRGVFAYR